MMIEKVWIMLRDELNVEMMISDDERREVAKRMRELPSDTYAALKEWEEGCLFIEASIGDEADYSQIHNAILGCFPAEYMQPGDYEELHERLADLIDRPTCHVTSRPGNDENDVCDSCSVCDFGWHKSRFDPPYRYCPNCGATVVE